MNRYVLSCIATLAIALSSVNTLAITVNLSASKDNTLYESPSGHLSNGEGSHFFAGFTGQAQLTRGLLMFDVAAELPSDAIITNATLTMRVSAAASPGIIDGIELRRVTTDWGEGSSVATGGGGGGGGGGPAADGDATWLHAFSPSTFWTNAGGDFVSTISATQGVGELGLYEWTSSQLASDVQDMLDTPNNNFGWIVFGDESASHSAKRFHSRESTSPPMLSIEYDLRVPEPTTSTIILGLLALGGIRPAEFSSLDF